MKRKGLVILNTGNGKGKTTAALGMVMRAWGRGMRVGVIQFIKSEDADYGEHRAARQMGFPLIPTGDGCIWQSKDIEETTRRARQGWELAKSYISSGEYDVIVLDEFTFPLKEGWLDIPTVITWLRENKPPDLHLVITGRDAPSELIDFADLVTEMKEIKHPLAEQGITAQAGVEF
jgi:cob(I)alamin adenosyltransferase